MNVGSHFPKPPWSCTTMTFFPSYFIGPYSWPWSYLATYTHIFFNTKPPLKVLCPTCEHQFIGWRFVHHQCSYQTFNYFDPNPYDHLGTIPFLIPTMPTSIWTWVSKLDVLKSFHLGLCCPCSYNHILTTLWHDVQMAFRFHWISWHTTCTMWQLGTCYSCYPNDVSFCPFMARRQGIGKCKFDSNVF